MFGRSLFVLLIGHCIVCPESNTNVLILYFAKKKIIFQNVTYLEGICNTWNRKTIHLFKIQFVRQITVSIILLCLTHYCVQQFNVSNKILCPHLIYVHLPIVDILRSYPASHCVHIYNSLFFFFNIII